MELIPNKRSSRAHRQDGLTIIELMIAMVILATGILACMGLVVVAINGDARGKQQTNSTALAQMVTERIMAVSASSSTLVTILDCTSTSYNVSTSAGGAPLNSSGDVDYTQSTVTNYYMPYTDCATQGRQAQYDVRWNIQSLSTYANLLTVSSRLKSAGTNGSIFAPVVTIRTIIGQ